MESIPQRLLHDTYPYCRRPRHRALRAPEAHRGQADWEVAAEAGDGQDAVRKAVETNPDIAVLDYYMPLLNGIEATRQIRARLPKTEVLIFTIHDDEKLIEDLLRAGARGYVSKAAAKQDLLDAIETVGAHRSFFGSNVTEILLKAYLAQPIRNEMPLSDQEMRVVKLVGEGHTNNQIAKILNITVRTAETHRATAMRKLNVSSSTGLVRHAVRIGLVEPLMLSETFIGLPARA
jgi:DNA-binding NarL/FixJ family response regulator